MEDRLLSRKTGSYPGKQVDAPVKKEAKADADEDADDDDDDDVSFLQQVPNKKVGSGVLRPARTGRRPA